MHCVWCSQPSILAKFPAGSWVDRATNACVFIDLVRIKAIESAKIEIKLR